MKYQYFQWSNNDCGLACLKTMIKYYKGEDLKMIPQKENYSFLDLKLIAEDNDFPLIGVEYDTSKLDELKPSIVLLEYNSYKHYVFFLGKKGKHVEIFDPQFGNRRIKLDDFLNYFKGYALITNIEKNKQKREKISKFYLLEIVLQSILLLPFFILFFFFSKAQIFPYLLIILVLIFLLLDRVITMIRMNRYDKTIERYIRYNEEIDEDMIKKLYLYKGAKFSYIKTLFMSIGLRILYFITCLEAPCGLFFIPLYLLYFVYDLLFYYRKKEANISLEILEKEQIEKENKYQMINKYSKIYIYKNEFIRYLFYIGVVIYITLGYFLFNFDLNILIPLSLFFVFFTFKDDQKELNRLSKNIRIGEDIIACLENK